MRNKAFSVDDISEMSILIHLMSYKSNRKSEMSMIMGLSDILGKHEIEIAHKWVEIKELRKRIKDGGNDAK